MEEDKANDPVPDKHDLQDLVEGNDILSDAIISDDEIVLILNPSSGVQDQVLNQDNAQSEPEFTLSSLNDLIIDDALEAISALEDSALTSGKSGGSATGKEETGGEVTVEAPIDTCGAGYLAIQIVMGNTDEESSSGLI